MPCRLKIADASYLRLLDEADASELHRLIEANRADLASWMPWAAEQTLDGTLGFLRSAQGQLLGNDGFHAAVVIEGGIAGVIGYPAVDWGNRSTSLGYWLDAGYRGAGTMTAAARLLVDHALSVWGLNRVEIRAAVENRASRAIPERLGFEEEGTLRQSELVGGRYLDCAVYSMVAAEWGRQARPKDEGGPSSA